ncbi:MAG TPA: hypothetical protein VI138_07755 [Candidatus Dormibacteraeota bacterium]
MRTIQGLGTIIGLAAVAIGIAACGGPNQGSLKGSKPECKASYTESGQAVTVKVSEHGPATIKAIVTDSHGDKHGATAHVTSGQAGVQLHVTSPPPLRRVLVQISESSGTSTCIATS